MACRKTLALSASTSSGVSIEKPIGFLHPIGQHLVKVCAERIARRIGRVKIDERHLIQAQAYHLALARLNVQAIMRGGFGARPIGLHRIRLTVHDIVVDAVFDVR